MNTSRWVHPAFTNLSADRSGPFLALADGSLMTVDDQGMRTSNDDGAHWSNAVPVCPGIPAPDGEPAAHRLLLTAQNAVVLVYIDFSTARWAWDATTREPKPGARRELFCVRSSDGGRTWTAPRLLLSGCNANFFGFIQTSTGRLVVSVPHLVSDPGRWVSCSVYSDDEGRTWARSNWIDLGGHGDHDGAMEPAVVELRDGRLLMLIRTALGSFWQACSDDQGRTWRTIRPLAIDASSAPGALVKLRSGRLVLAWNRLKPSDGGEITMEHDKQKAEFPAPNHRRELSLATSEDDAKTWSEFVVIARQSSGGQFSYPYVFERRPGEIWITAGFTWLGKWGGDKGEPLRLRIDETTASRVPCSLEPRRGAMPEKAGRARKRHGN